MSTKVNEKCKKCHTDVVPETHHMFIQQHHVMIGIWRYRCGCGNIWANEAQRVHNSDALNKAIRNSHGIYM